jgi:hypothetical protein
MAFSFFYYWYFGLFRQTDRGWFSVPGGWESPVILVVVSVTEAIKGMSRFHRKMEFIGIMRNDWGLWAPWTRERFVPLGFLNFFLNLNESMT